MSMAGRLRGLFIFTNLVAVLSFYLIEYSNDLSLALVAVSFLGLLVAFVMAKLIRVKVVLARRRHLKRKFFKKNYLDF